MENRYDRYEKQVKRYCEMVSMRTNGKTIRQMANHFGISKQAVSQRLIKGMPKKIIPKIIIPKSKDHKYKYTEETREILRRLKGRGHTRMLVRIRDDFTCQDCGKYSPPDLVSKTRMHDVHHINGLCGKLSRAYDKVSSMDGLVTLCHKCHFNRPEHTVKRKSYQQVHH